MSKEAPVGFRAVRVQFELDSDATPEQSATLLKLTGRYCVVAQTVKNPTPVTLAIP